jgi:hypothetical protein
MDSRFTKVPKAMNEDSRIHPVDFAVYSSLDYYASDSGIAWPGLSKIAEMSRLSRPTVVSSIRRLVACGYVQKKQRHKPNGKGFTSSIYLMVLRAESPYEAVNDVAGGSKGGLQERDL